MGVPVHKGIKGNEEADIIAKEEVITNFPSTETFCRLSKKHIKLMPYGIRGLTPRSTSLEVSKFQVSNRLGSYAMN